MRAVLQTLKKKEQFQQAEREVLQGKHITMHRKGSASTSIAE